ncbi:MAG: glyoxalase/bleomycin resistance/dioxygenase family protein [Gammaproteobacteria bacterium]|nr:glyoxalase/bleomycin resistance/dioxygenase family protein [Gammaproteobacteria bacterium]
MPPAAVLVSVPDVDLGLAWYQKAFPMAQPRCLGAVKLRVLDISGFAIELVPADAKVAAGKGGTVLYWSVDCINTALVSFEQLGAKLYRGPMAIEAGLSMCQIEGPFGNLIGLRGKSTA